MRYWNGTQHKKYAIYNCSGTKQNTRKMECTWIIMYVERRRNSKQRQREPFLYQGLKLKGF